MLPRFLLPETVARQDGSGSQIAVDSSCTALQLTLGITRIIEEASLEVSICGSPDGERWYSLATFPEKCYCGNYSMVLDLSQHPEIRHLRAEWKMGRWGQRMTGPLFGFSVSAKEVKVRHAVAV